MVVPSIFVASDLREEDREWNGVVQRNDQDLRSRMSVPLNGMTVSSGGPKNFNKGIIMFLGYSSYHTV